jgi:hypothetical protein
VADRTIEERRQLTAKARQQSRFNAAARRIDRICDTAFTSEEFGIFAGKLTQAMLDVRVREDIADSEGGETDVA